MTPLHSLRDIGLLLTRVLLGVVLFAHGWQKLATNGLDATAAGFTQMGVPLPEISVALAAGIETVGGVLLVLGALTPLAGIAAAFVMAGAFWFVHAGNGLFAADGGWELVAVIALAAIQLALVGPGRYSVDALLARRRGRDRDAESSADATHGERLSTGAHSA